MLHKFKKLFGNLLKKILPFKIYKLIANGFIIVPAYYKEIIDDVENNFNLSLQDSDDKEILLMRKYAHIIDKGLHRQDVTPGHSKNFYLLLSNSVKRLQNSKYANDQTLVWAKEKLNNYEELQKNPSNFEPLKGEKQSFNISLSEFEKLIKARRSNRDFSDKPVSNEDISRISSLAHWASSSCNKQPIEIYTTNNPSIAKECLSCCKGGTGFSENIPSFWVFTANILGYVYPSELHLPYVDTALGIQNVMLGATTLGLSATLLSWAQKSKDEEIKLKKLLNIPEHHQIILCAVMGYANSYFKTPARKNS